MFREWNTTALTDVAIVSLSGVDKHVLPGEADVRLCNYLDVYRNRRLHRAMSFSRGTATAGEIARFSLNRGDVLITKDSETPDDIGIPAVVVDQLPNVVCGYHLALIRPSDALNSSFLCHYLQGEQAKRHFLRNATGVTRFGLGTRAIESLRVPVLHLDEQAAIARILDAMDTAIERTREAVEKAVVLRRALMQDLLPPWIGFRHLGADQTLSGVETIELAKDVADVCNGSTPSRTEGRYWRNGTIAWLPTGKVHDRVIVKANEYVTAAALRECSISLLPPGTVLVGMIGQGRTRGMSAYLDTEACINQNFGAFVPREKVFGKWLFYYFDYHYSRLREVGGGTNQGALNCYLLKRIRLPLPRRELQEKVALVLDSVEGLQRARNLTLQHQLNLKVSLMHDLLTGKVRVNNVNLDRMATA